MKKTVLAVLLFSGVVFASQPAMVKLKAKLTGASIGGIVPHGHGRYHSFGSPATHSSLSVEVEDVHEDIGTVLSVLLNGASIGTITLACPVPVVLPTILADKDCEQGELELNSREGDIVPVVVAGNVVSVADPTGATILTGVFGPFPVRKTHKGKP
jgi:hypothetical protein